MIIRRSIQLSALALTLMVSCDSDTDFKGSSNSEKDKQGGVVQTPVQKQALISLRL